MNQVTHPKISKDTLPDHIELIGAVAYHLLKNKMMGEEHSLTSPEGNLIISRCSKEMVAALIYASEDDSNRPHTLQFCLNEDDMLSYDLKKEHLTDENAVQIRNMATEGKFFVSAEFENETQSSGSTTSLNAQDLEDSSNAGLWVDSFDELSKMHFQHPAFGSSEQKDNARALVAGLFSLHRVSLATASQYIWATFSLCYQESLKIAAGLSLPKLSLPRFNNCFDGIRETQPSAWRNKLQSHWRNETYLRKRDDKFNHLEKNILIKSLSLCEEEGVVIPDALKQAFEAYASSKPERTLESENLLFEFDWADVNQLLVGAKSKKRTKLGTKTKDLFKAENSNLNQDNEDLLDRLDSPRKNHNDEELRDFFDYFRTVLEQDSVVYKGWEKLVFDKEVSCTNLLQGILECLYKSQKGPEVGEKQLSILLIGISQEKPNSFKQKNKTACFYFEHQYRSLEKKLGGRVRFINTKALQYTDEVFNPHLKPKKLKLNSVAKKNCCLEFRVRIIAEDGEERTTISEHKLVWRFEVNSVMSGYLGDLARLSKNNSGSALIECTSDRDATGAKGVPLTLSLKNTSGFQDGPSGKGSFVPALLKGKLYSLVPKWVDELTKAELKGIVTEKSKLLLEQSFNNFELIYNNGIKELTTDELGDINSKEIAKKFGDLLELVARIPDESTRRRLMKPLLLIGTVQVPASLGEDIVTIICPWHPIRLEANQARITQHIDIIQTLLSDQKGEFCDSNGSLFFSDLKQLAAFPLRPEITVGWEGVNKLKPTEHVVSQNLEAYSLHDYPFAYSDGKSTIHDDSKKPAEIIRDLVEEYLRLQPHERDNLSLALYNCDSTTLPVAVVEQINKLNEKRKSKGRGTKFDEITCQVLLTHRDKVRLRETYKSLLSQASDPDKLLGTEVTGDFLSRVRINITAASKIPSSGMVKPVDIALCQDVVSRKAKAEWHRIKRTILSSEEIMPHQWGRRDTVTQGGDVSRLFLVCPAQTIGGWQYLLGVASIFINEGVDTWDNDMCHVLTRKIDFSEQELGTIFKDTHRIATWVANYDELLDRRLLEAKDVKVIRYSQSTTHGRNLVISSDAANTFLEAAINDKILGILGIGTPPETITKICKKIMKDANLLSGGLILKAARRIKNTHELLGCVLSRFIVESQLKGKEIGTAWCMLDDYAFWLGKKPETGIADILALSPIVSKEGKKHLNVIITEAKFVDYDGLASSKKKSATQLADTVSQFQRATESYIFTDRSLVLARLSELLANNLRSHSFTDAENWKSAIRSGECSIRVRGLSHVFCHGPKDNLSQQSTFTGVTKKDVKECYQEVLNHQALQDLLLAYAESEQEGTYDKVQRLRVSNGAMPEEIGGIDISMAPIISSPLNVVDTPSPTEETEEVIIKPDSQPSSSSEDKDDQKDESIIVSSDEHVPGRCDVSADTTTPSLLKKNSNPIEFLTQSVNSLSEIDTTTEEWVKEISRKTRASFINRGMSFNLTREPVLSPNSLIFKIKGTTGVTTNSILRVVEEIKTTDGVDILSVVSEVGQISVSVKRYPRAILPSEVMFFRYLEAIQKKEVQSYDIPVAVCEDDNSLIYLRPFEQPHSLVAGATGSGKSVLLRNIMTAIALGQSPEETQISLIDAKGGLDFACLFDLPNIIEYDGQKLVEKPEQALHIFSEIILEMDERYQLFKAAGADNLMSYRKKTGNIIPIRWIIHDEFGIWMQDDKYRKEVEPLINTLAKKARAAGIFLVLADQRPDNTVFPMQTRSNLDNRLTLKVTDKGTSKISLEAEGAEQLLKHGHMLAKTADYPSPVYCQVPYIEIDAIAPLIKAISESTLSN